MNEGKEKVRLEINEGVVNMPKPIANKISEILHGLVHQLGYPHVKMESKEEISDGLKKIIKALGGKESD